MKIFSSLTFLLYLLLLQGSSNCSAQEPVRIAVAGTSHGHASWILGKNDRADIVIMGIYEKDKQLAEKHITNFKLSRDLFYNNLESMLDKIKPEAVVAFGSIHDHMSVVEACAPRGIHVMVEKPLAVSVAHAIKMQALAKKHRIYVLTNYETSWYPVTTKVHQLAVDSNYIGTIRKAVFHHGHEGPKEIGVSSEFLEWLTDPVENGGGAIIDFGCYGANIMTWLMNGVPPVSVTAVTRQYKPLIYKKVDDEATIVVDYPHAQAIIQASWNWPFSRKDMEVYGEKGYLITSDGNRMKRKNRFSESGDSITIEETNVYKDPFTYFADVIRKRITVPEFSLYSLSNNVMVVKILEAAKKSAASGKKQKIN